MHVERVDDGPFIEQLGRSSATSGVRTLDVVHQSDIIKVLMRQLQPKRFGNPMDANALLRMEMGMCFEDIISRGLADKFATVRPPEFVSDEGVYLSPDGINPTLDCGEEYKCTWMSSRVKPKHQSPYTDEYGLPNEKYMHWFFQMKGYAKWLQTNRFLLRVLHVNGDYSYPMKPQFLSHLLTFTWDEIDDNWRLLMRVASDAGLVGTPGNPSGSV